MREVSSLNPRQRLGIRLAAIALVVVLLVLAQQFGLLQRFADPARLRQTLLGLGPRGYLVFVLAYAALQPFGVPGTVFVWAAPLIWPWPIAFALSMVGTMAASVVGFSFARFIARDWLAARIPQRFRKYDAALAERAFATVFWLRLVLWMPQFLHAFFGVSQVRFSTHFWASLAGYALPLFLVSFFGQALVDFLLAIPPAYGVALGVLVVAGAAVWLSRRRLRSVGENG